MVASIIRELPYPIVVEPGGIARLGAIAASHAPAYRYAVVTDTVVAALHLEAAVAALASAVPSDRVHRVIVPAGEQHKTRERWAAITDTLLSERCGRDTTIIALGGGVIGDLAGFVAATYMRGVTVIQVPTTLLAMVDASIGGKTGVDTPAGKNLVGAFHAPAAVIADPVVLETLPARLLRAGLAEVIKHGVIADAEELDRARSIGRELRAGAVAGASLGPLVARSAAVKARIVALDEREAGLRKVLNFGHTVGHAVETATEYSLLHGEAVAIGMVAEARLAERAGIAEPGTAELVERAVVEVGLPSRLPAQLEIGAVLSPLRRDKKSRNGAVEYALPRRIGTMAGERSGWAVAVSEATLCEVLQELR